MPVFFNCNTFSKRLVKSKYLQTQSVKHHPLDVLVKKLIKKKAILQNAQDS